MTGAHLVTLRRILIVSYLFPPAAEVGGIRIAQLCRYLSLEGVEPVVLSVEAKFYRKLDPSRLPPPGVHVISAPMMPTPLDWYGNLKWIFKGFNAPPKLIAAGNPATAGEAVKRGFLRRHVLASLQIPDRYWGWYLPAIRAADEFVSQSGVDAILSSGPPWISHLVARHLKRKYGKPWLLDFRDPWASFAPASVLPKWWHHLAKHMEESCIRSADLVLCNTSRLCHAYQQRYSHLSPGKFQTLTNGFGDLTVSETEKVGSKLALLHLGSLYGRRRIDGFLIALANLVRSGELPAESFEVIFQGETDDFYLAQAEEIVPDLLRNTCIQFRGRIDWAQASEIIWQADLLLLFQGNQELQVPAKFYEYLQTGIPIFAITEEGALTDVLEATDSGLWVRPNDPQAIADKLLQALKLRPWSQTEVSNRLSNQYHYRSLAKQLSKWIYQLSSLSRRRFFERPN
jgi:glycosyltransferase involved in cell wall biosynthesis